MAELLEHILSSGNMLVALNKVKANKGAGGVDGISTKEIDQYFKDNWVEIKDKIRQRKYKPKPVKRVEIPKPNGGVRNLGIPTIVDRVIEQAIAQVLTPIAEPHFSDNSYGFRPNRRAQQAIVKLLEYFNGGNIYVVDIDLEKFFDNVPQDKLMTLVHNLINDSDTESLIRKYLNAGVMINGQLKPGYNLQIATCSELILNYKVFSNPTDVKTLIPFLVDLKEKDFHLKNIVADAGYESYENYQYIENNSLIPYIKPQQYEKSKTRNFQKDLNRPENLVYNAKTNTLIRKDGLELKYVGYGIKNNINYKLYYNPETDKNIWYNYKFREYSNQSKENICSELGK